MGCSKNAGKTAALNRLRSEAYRAGVSGFGLCTSGWDGEEADHLTGLEKPAVVAFEGDWVATSGRLFAKAAARFEILWAASESGRFGRMAVGRCTRPGRVQLVSPPSVRLLGDIIRRLREAGATRVLIDGAADRRTPISSVSDGAVGLVFSSVRHDSPERLARRVQDALERYRVPRTELPRPSDLTGHGIAYLKGGRWRRGTRFPSDWHDASDPPEAAWCGGPLTSGVLNDLSALGVRRIVVEDPSRIFLDRAGLALIRKRNTLLESGAVFPIEFVSIRCDADTSGSLPLRKSLDALRPICGDIPVFDPWAAREEPS